MSKGVKSDELLYIILPRASGSIWFNRRPQKFSWIPNITWDLYNKRI